MSTNIVRSENFDVTLVSEIEYNRLKKEQNTLEGGASAVLEALQMLCEDLEDTYEEPISYERCFSVIKTVVNTALEDDKIMKAVLSGVITPHKTMKTTLRERQMLDEKEQKIVRILEAKRTRSSGKRNLKDLNKEEVFEYAEYHSNKEVMEKFGFVSLGSVKQFFHLNNFKRTYPRGSLKGNVIKEVVSKVGSNLSVAEIAELYNCTNGYVRHLLNDNNIKYKRVRKTKNVCVEVKNITEQTADQQLEFNF